MNQAQLQAEVEALWPCGNCSLVVKCEIHRAGAPADVRQACYRHELPEPDLTDEDE